MKKFTKQILTGVIALGLLAPVATSSLNPIKTTINAKRHHAHRNYFPHRFFGRWYASKPSGMRHGHKRGGSVYIRVNRHGDYVRAPRFRGYIHPRYWTSGYYGEYHGQYGIMNHGRTFLFNGLAKNKMQAGWYLHRI